MADRQFNGSWSRVIHRNLSKWLRHELAHNALSLYSVQMANYLVPLVTMPYLARVLGVAGWGLVAFAQAFGTYVVLVGEYAFAYSATREVARLRDDQEKLAQITGGVLGAKGLLTIAAVAGAFLVRGRIPLLRAQPLLFWCVMFWAASQAASMRWFFRGLEQMKLLAVVEVSARGLSLLGVFALVHRPGDEWRVFLVQGAGPFLAFLVCVVLAYRKLPFRVPTSTSVREALHMGRGLFLFESSVSLYTAANTFILGLFAPPEIVGFYAGAEKIVRAALRLLDPITQTIYPRISYLFRQAPDRAARLARSGTALMVACGFCLSVFVFLFASAFVRVLLGAGYSDAVALLRILALVPVLDAWSTALGIQWAMPLGLERELNIVTTVAGIINVGLAVLLARVLAAVGMAWIVVIAEVFIATGLYFILRVRRLELFAGNFGLD